MNKKLEAQLRQWHESGEDSGRDEEKLQEDKSLNKYHMGTQKEL